MKARTRVLPTSLRVRRMLGDGFLTVGGGLWTLD